MIFININKIKIFLLIIILTVISALSLSPTYTITYKKLLIKLILILILKFFYFVFYERHTTAIDGFIDNKTIGKGAKSFRYFCKEEKYVNKLPVIFEQISLENLLDFDEGFITDIYFKMKLLNGGSILYSNLTEEKTFFSKSNLFPDQFYF